MKKWISGNAALHTNGVITPKFFSTNIDNNLSLRWKRLDIKKKSIKEIKDTYWLHSFLKFWEKWLSIFRIRKSRGEKEKLWIITEDGVILDDNFDAIYPSTISSNIDKPFSYSMFERSWKWWLIKEDWTIIGDEFDECGSFNYWCATFKKDWHCGWIDTQGDVIAEWFDCCREFKNWFAQFLRDGEIWRVNNSISDGISIFQLRNWTEWWVKRWWKVIAKWLKNCQPFESWYARFQGENKRGIIDISWKILVDWLDQCWVFYKWLAVVKFPGKEKQLIDTKWNIFTEVTKWWTKYLEKDWKLYIKNIIQGKIHI
jgi:hypothetical protein